MSTVHAEAMPSDGEGPDGVRKEDDTSYQARDTERVGGGSTEADEPAESNPPPLVVHHDRHPGRRHEGGTWISFTSENELWRSKLAQCPASTEVEARIEEPRQPFPGGGRELRLLLDALEIDRALEREVPEGEPDVPHPHPRPAEPQRQHEEDPIDHVETQERAAGDRRV